MSEATQSKKLKAGGKYFFFDIRQAKNGSNYLLITESRTDANGQRVRNCMTLFGEQVQDFSAALSEMAQLL